MTITEVKQFLRDNADKEDVKAFMAEFKVVSPEQKEEVIDTYKKSVEFRSEVDKAVTRGINTYSEKTVPTLVEKAVKDKETELETKYNPPKNAAEEAIRKQLEAVQAELTETRNKTIREAIKNAKQSMLSEMGLPVELADAIYVKADGLSVNDVEDREKLRSLITPALEPIAKFGESVKTAKANEMLAGSATRPTSGNANPAAGQLKREDLKNMKPEEIAKARESGQLDSILGRN